MKNIKVVHLTSVHYPLDVRILYKECRTLAKEGSEVVLVAPYHGDETIAEVQIRAVPVSKSRFQRFTRTGFDVFRAALKEKADLYHFHDPELLPVGVLLKILGKRVVYDVHEDLPRQIISKQWIPGVIRKIIARITEVTEALGSRFLDGVVAATPAIAKRFPASKTVTVQNFPLLEEFNLTELKPYKERSSLIAYVGNLTRVRGVKEMVKAMAALPMDSDVRLAIAGLFSPAHLEDDVRMEEGWDRIDYLGWQDRKDISILLGRARVGLVVLHPIQNYLLSYPVKLFEYMAAGLPVIASDFPLWRDIIEDADCGILVDPLDTKNLATEIKWLIGHPDEAEKMGERGQKAVFSKYNWGQEAGKLLELYKKILVKN